MPPSLKTAGIRISANLASKIDEIARLTKTRTAAVCDRLFGSTVERELTEVRERELARLQAEKQGE